MFEYDLADRIIRFCEQLKVPEGDLIGQDIKLINYQREFIRNVFKTKNGKRPIRLGLISLGRKNAKTSTICMILLAMMTVKGLAKPNAQIASGGKSREQASVIFELMKKMIQFSPELSKRLKIIDSKKKIINMKNGCEYTALSSDAGNALGKSLYMYVHDETANLKEDSKFPEACMSSQLAYDDALSIHISTIGASDVYYFNQLIEQYKDNRNKSVHCVYYTIPENAEGIYTDPKVWALANPALNHFLSETSMRAYAEQAVLIPSKRAYFLNFLCNQKISSEESFMQNSDWTAIQEDFDYSDFYGLDAVAAVDLSLGAYDFTSLVIIVKVGDNQFKALPYTFSAKGSIETNEARLKAPLQAWSMDESAHYYLSGGRTFDWEVMSKHFVEILSNFNIIKIGVDAYRWEDIQREFNKLDYDAPVEKLRQNYAHFNSYVSALENMVYDGKLRHNGNPLLGFGMASAVLIPDREGNKKIFKRSQNTAIDPAIALCMASYMAETNLSSHDASEWFLPEFV